MSAAPTKYERNYNFNDFQTSNPSTPLPGLQVDAELNDLKTTTDAIIDRLAEIQRDDGPLENASVGLDQIHPDLLAYIDAAGGGGEGGGEPGSGVTDFNGRDGSVEPILGDYTAALVTFTPAGDISASTVQSAIEELDSEKASQTDVDGKADAVHTHTPADVGATVAGAALMEAATASAQRSALALGSAATLNVGVAANNIPQLDSSGKMPAVDGSQLTNIVSAAVPTGTIFDTILAAAPTGYVMLSGRTMGNAASGGTERANADTATLFAALWNNLADAQAPVSGGRGASAAADFAANKTITLPSARDRVRVGKGNMGGTDAALVDHTLTGSVDTLTLGASGGEGAHALTSAENGPHIHDIQTKSSSAFGSGKPAGGVNATGSDATDPTDSSGNGTAHNTMQPSLVINVIIKL